MSHRRFVFIMLVTMLAFASSAFAQSNLQSELPEAGQGLLSHQTAALNPDVIAAGDGVFLGTLTHDGTNGSHPWYEFCGNQGDTVTLNLDSPGVENYLWVYEVLDGQWENGNSVGGGELVLVADQGGGTNTNLVFVLPSSNQYVVQVDSFIGQSGDYTYTQTGTDSGACPFAVPATSKVGMFFLSMLLMVVLTSGVTLWTRN